MERAHYRCDLRSGQKRRKVGRWAFTVVGVVRELVSNNRGSKGDGGRGDRGVRVELLPFDSALVKASGYKKKEMPEDFER